MVNNPVLEELAEGVEEISPEELQPLLEGEAERVAEPADKGLLEALRETPDLDVPEASAASEYASETVTEPVAEAPNDPFDEIDFGSFFDEYLDPGHKSPASESVEKPSFETFLSQPQTLPDHLRSQLSVSLIPDNVRDAAESIIGNLDEDGYISSPLDEIAQLGGHSVEDIEAGLKAVQSLEPAGVGARDVRECLLLQLEGRNAKDGVAWLIVSKHLRLLETRQFRELAKVLGRPVEHIEIAVNLIQHLNPRPGIRFSGQEARAVEPDVYFIKDGDDYLIQMNDDELPQLRLNRDYHRMLDRQNGSLK